MRLHYTKTVDLCTYIHTYSTTKEGGKREFMRPREQGEKIGEKDKQKGGKTILEEFQLSFFWKVCKLSTGPLLCLGIFKSFLLNDF